MINEIRNTVLEIINKDNNGYITPAEFNDFSRTAQLEVHHELFADYSRAVNKRIAHTHTSGHGDIPKRLEEVINIFTFDDTLTYNVLTLRFELPSDMYSTGTIFLANGGTEVEHVHHNKILYLNNSSDVPPTETYPVYTQIGDEIKVYPTTIATTGSVLINYVRYPADPKWTWTTLAGGEPVFNQAPGLGYQDFELPKSFEAKLISKICQYAGTSIREEQVVKYMKAEEIQENAEEQ